MKKAPRKRAHEAVAAPVRVSGERTALGRVAGVWAAVSFVAMLGVLVCSALGRPSGDGVFYGSRMLDAPEAAVLALLLAGLPLLGVSFLRSDARARAKDYVPSAAAMALFTLMALHAFFVGRVVLWRATAFALEASPGALDVTARLGGVALRSLRLRDEDVSALRMDLSGSREIISRKSSRPMARAELVAVLRDGGEIALGYSERVLAGDALHDCAPPDWRARAASLARSLGVPLTYARVERTQHPLESTVEVPACASAR